MKLSKIIPAVCALVIIAVMGIAVLAAPGDSVFKDKTKDDIFSKDKFNALQKKWSALTDEQKEEIYALKEKAADIQAQIIDKYQKWGIIDKSTADDMKEKITERKNKMRKSDKIPMPGIRGRYGKNENKRIPLNTAF
jgi:Zn-dependent M16 (insulinase) family peptidase